MANGAIGQVSQGLINSGLKIQFFSVSTGFMVEFPMIVKSFSDKYQSDWNSQQVFGRMDPIATFKGTKRTIALTFRVLSENQQESKYNMQKISSLMNFLYPNYSFNPTSEAATIASSPILKIKFINWMQDTKSTNTSTSQTDRTAFSSDAQDSGLMGYVDGFTFNPAMDKIIDKDEEGIYPRDSDISFNFTVLHSHKLGFDIGSLKNNAINTSNTLKNNLLSPNTKFPYNLDQVAARKILGGK